MFSLEQVFEKVSKTVLREKELPPMSVKQRRKLTRTFAVASLLVVIGAGFSAVGNASESGAVDPHAGYVLMVVGNGETLWDIATLASNDQSVQSVVDQIVSENHLASPDVRGGMKLWVPDK